MLAVIVNPVCGTSGGRQLAQDDVLPLLTSHGRHPDFYAETEGPGHAGRLLVDWFARTVPLHHDPAPIDIILISGDGTLHEIVNALYHYQNENTSHLLPQIRFVLVPAGTANALHASLCLVDRGDSVLASLRVFLSNTSTNDEATPYASLSPLNLARTIFHPPSPSSPSPPPTPEIVPKPVISAIVTSTSLHASILQDSEALRYTVPGLERFKTAAVQNAARWYHARVRLLPFPTAEGSQVQIYDASSDRFTACPSQDKEDSTVELEGPFVYFLTTVNVDRLETQFQIAPLARSHTSEGGSMDLVVVRPMRDPSVESNNRGARVSFGSKTWKVLGAAYDRGAHIRLRYGDNGEIIASNEGPSVVEYFRVGGWEWIPDAIDRKAHIVCADGTVLEIARGGTARCTVLGTTDHNLDIAVYTHRRD